MQNKIYFSVYYMKCVPYLSHKIEYCDFQAFYCLNTLILLRYVMHLEDSNNNKYS